jgi:tetratricopeptide (TPR) repeat protein
MIGNHMAKKGGISYQALGMILACAIAATFIVPHAFGQYNPDAQSVEYNNLGIAAYNNGNYTEAIGNFEKAHEISPEKEVVRRNLCNAHQAVANKLAKDTDYDLAIRHLQLAVGIDPENHSPFIQLGSYYLQKDDVNKAIYSLEEAIELKPGVLDAHELLGEAYYRDNDIPSARAQWDYVLEMDPSRTVLRKRYEKAFREESVEYDFNRSGSRHFRITYPAGVSYQLRQRVLTILERAYMDYGRRFDGVWPPAPIQVIVYGAEQFEEATQLASYVGAVYDGKIRAPLTDRGGAWLPMDELERRLRHEYVHVIVRHLSRDNVPWWLNEGLAEFNTRELSEHQIASLQRAYRENRAFPLSYLTDNPLKKMNSDLIQLAYTQSQATVQLLVNRFGQRRMNQLLTQLGDNVPPADAIQRVYRRTLSQIEEEAAESVF